MRKIEPAPRPKRSAQPTVTDKIPRRVMHPTLDDHLEVMTRAIFQAGLSWAMIDARWTAFQLAFDRFEITRVAQYGTFEIDRLMATDGIVHSAKKLVGTVANATALLGLEGEFGSVGGYAERFGCYADLLADARVRFAFLGDLSCYYWLFRTGGPVPTFETWIAGQPKDHPRMREMVLAGRAEQTSTERPGF